MIKIDLSNLPKITNDSFIPLYKNKHRFLVLKGGAGSGKSVFVGQKIVYRMLTEQYPRHPHKFLVIRKVGKTIRESCWALILTTIRKWGMGKLFKVNKSDFSITCKLNGNQIIFAGIDDPEKIKSITDITGIWVEEASEISKNDLYQLNLRLRGWTPFYKQIMLSFNPISLGNYLRREFFVHKREDALIHNSTYLDNKFIDEQYRQQLEAFKQTNPYYYQVYVLNEWGSAKGAAFPEFSNKPNELPGNEGWKFTHVIRPFNPPKEWKYFRSFDWGYAKPFSLGWWAMNNDGVLFRILELYGCTSEPNTGVRWENNKIATRIAEVEDSHPYLKGRQISGIADPSIWDKSRGEAIVEAYARRRIWFDPADNKRIPGKMQVHYRLAFDENGMAMMYVFDHCKDFIRTIPELIEDEKDPEDVDTDGEDHIYDEARYLCQMNPIPPRRDVPVRKPKYNPLESEVVTDRYGFMRL